MAIFKILGYTNPIESICSPLITIVQKGKHTFASFPVSTIKRLVFPENETYEEIKGFIPERKKIKLEKGQYSYIDSKGNVHTQNQRQIIELMKLDLPYLELNDPELADILKNYIAVENIELAKIANKKSFTQNVILYTTTRIKKNKEKAKRIILQHRKNGSFKTAYRKNLYTDESIQNQDESRFKDQLQRKLNELSERYKNGNIKNYYHQYAM